MKKQILVILVAVISLSANAQRKTAVSGYGAATAEINNIDARANLSVGAYGGVLLNHRLLIGAAGSNTFLKKTITAAKPPFNTTLTDCIPSTISIQKAPCTW
jgi:hypothetical protein